MSYCLLPLLFFFFSPGIQGGTVEPRNHRAEWGKGGRSSCPDHVFYNPQSGVQNNRCHLICELILTLAKPGHTVWHISNVLKWLSSSRLMVEQMLMPKNNFETLTCVKLYISHLLCASRRIILYFFQDNQLVVNSNGYLFFFLLSKKK